MSDEYPLHAAVVDNDLEEVNRLLAQDPAQVNTPDEDGNTPLSLVVQCGNYSIACRLVEHGAVIAPAMLKEGGLHEAARYNEVNKARFLLLGGMDINATDADGNTPLHIACLDDAMYEAPSNFHDAPSQEWKAETVELLLQHGANCWCWNKNKVSPLWCALFSKNFVSVKLLVEHGAELWSWLLHEACRVQDEDIVEFLLSQGCDANGRYDPNDPNVSPATVLHTLCQCSDVDAYNCSSSARIAKILLTHGADVNALDEQGQSPLFYALRGGCLESWKTLIEHRGSEIDVADVVNIQDHNGNTPLHFLLMQGNTERYVDALQWLSVLSDATVRDKAG